MSSANQSEDQVNGLHHLAICTADIETAYKFVVQFILLHNSQLEIKKEREQK